MSEHHVSVTVHAPIEQVYAFFTHFNDFPKFMSFVKEVTYYDERRSHWVAQIAGTHEWDAVNESWIPNQQVGWRSTSGLANSGLVRFDSMGTDSTRVDVYISYTPPAGVAGRVVNSMGIDERFQTSLQQDMENFARMVEEAPQGALDPMQSHYLFHDQSAVAKHQVTSGQQASMQSDPMMNEGALQSRQQNIQQEAAHDQQLRQQEEITRQQRQERERQAAQQQSDALRAQAERDRADYEARANQSPPTEHELDPVRDTIGGRNAAMPRSALGDQDARSERYPQYHEDPMLARGPRQQSLSEQPAVSDVEIESPWRANIHGAPEPDEEEANRE
ncbi:SRPBCC family protein [Dictyobacter aurantiacus]|uniref:Coenzyme Q-binding protein COQ10 START domain-containing protein n=1 Tax=Dictyobacter aurantiacus TaxID=1936993 RepID=A0A401ZFX3_9CHLR|nr:SRPBCC family protein [Dictyobacter aurantiacus]GCE05736.1 hypothetical protein KDAU_30650 [Dictyobacter aurantiacus]